MGMKRVIASVVLIVLPVLIAPVAALAQSGSGLNPPQGPTVGGAGGSTGDPGGIAFTGAETFQLIALVLALAAVGTLLLVLTRRRREAQVGLSR